MKKHAAGPATGPKPLTAEETKAWWAKNHPLPTVEDNSVEGAMTIAEMFATWGVK